MLDIFKGKKSVRYIMSIFVTAVMLFVICLSGCQSSLSYEDAKNKASTALSKELDNMRKNVYVYADFGDSRNAFSQKMALVPELAKQTGFDENWTVEPYSGKSCIRIKEVLYDKDWNGWAFLNGLWNEENQIMELNRGEAPNEGLDLTGAEKLTFWARGAKGDENVEFFTLGFGYNENRDILEYTDSSIKKYKKVRLSNTWQKYEIDLTGTVLTNISCGFGYMAEYSSNSEEIEFYLDEIKFESTKPIHCMDNILLRSYETENKFIAGNAYSYDNALAAMAFISENKQEEAKEILDAFVYAAEHDRYKNGRVRNSYRYGSIMPYCAGSDKAALPGWYEEYAEEWREDAYSVSCGTGNTSYVALALLQYARKYSENKYAEIAEAIMNWVIDNCSDETPGFNAGYEGWPEAGEDKVEKLTYKSLEHNIDAYAVFKQLYKLTGKAKYKDAFESCRTFIDSMYDKKQALFSTGTALDGVTPDWAVTPLDTTVWCRMALGSEFDEYSENMKFLDTLERENGGYPFSDKSTPDSSIWSEGTAFTALMFKLIGDEAQANKTLDSIIPLQNENGFFAASDSAEHFTGMYLSNGKPWNYSTDLHLAPTAWFIMAVNGFNPYSFD